MVRISMGQRYPYLGTYVDALTMEETIDRIIHSIKNKTPLHLVALNAGKIVLFHKNKELISALNDSEHTLFHSDGQAVVLGARLLGIPITERVTGVDLMMELIKVAEDEQLRIFFLGATDEVIDTSLSILKSKHPKLQISGTHHGYFPEKDSEAIIEGIRDHTDILFVAMPSPKKEQWINKHLPKLGPVVSIGVGGSLDVLSGKTKRAPVWAQKACLEWFFRFIQEPHRLFLRYVIGNSLFIFYTIRAYFAKLRGRYETRHI
jgi:N-acetylglucosaminyldiphosphoundecaprenol N-acetyl-beta-D-mannosaminyltransferase